MRLAYTMTPDDKGLDPLLYDVAQDARAAGLRLAGLVQVNTDRPGQARCDMDAVVLPDGPTIRISQRLGDGSRGCRLDASGLEAAIGAAAARMADGIDLLLVNKFGKQEAAGRGFRPLIADALEMGADVLVGVNGMNLDALRGFAGDALEAVPADRTAIMAWIKAARADA